MKITLAAPSVCPELHSYMHFLDMSLHRITFMELYAICLSPTFTIPDSHPYLHVVMANGQSLSYT